MPTFKCAKEGCPQTTILPDGFALPDRWARCLVCGAVLCPDHFRSIYLMILETNVPIAPGQVDWRLVVGNADLTVRGELTPPDQITVGHLRLLRAREGRFDYDHTLAFCEVDYGFYKHALKVSFDPLVDAARNQKALVSQPIPEESG